MKEVSSTTWSFQMIIIFILIFACFLTLVLSYSKAYSIKNKMISVIEKYEGITKESGDVLNNFVSNQSYVTTAKCPKDDDWWGAENIYTDSINYELAQNDKNYYYCFKEKSVNDEINYEVIVFYKFNLPFLGEFMTYKIKGVTMDFAGNPERVTKGEEI